MKKLMDAAYDYALRGWYVFPLYPKSKVPFPGSNGFKDATTDPDKIKKMWTDYPDANIGIATGPSNLVVIDLDIRNEKSHNGVIRKNEWEKENGRLPETVISNTGGGGLHIFYHTKCKISSTAGLFGDGIDVRADGGYIIAPPSIHPSGKEYYWENSPDYHDIAEADDLVLKFIADGISGRGKRTKIHKDPLADYQIEGNGKIIRKGIRNSSCFQLACDGFKKGLNYDVVQVAVSAFNNRQCEPPLSDQEVSRTVKSAQKHVREQYSEEQLSLELPCAADVTEKEVDWFEDERIPKNHVTFLVSDGGDGKSTISCAIAAAASAGRKSFLTQGDGKEIETTPKKVLMLSGEDTMEETIRRRLRKNGACMENIKYIDVKDKRFDLLSLDSTLLKDLLEKHRPDLVVVDPIQGFIPKSSNMVARNSMRKVFGPLIRYGAEYDTTFLMVAHTNKRDGVSGRKRMSDSSDMWDLARSVMIIGHTPEDGILYISHEKSNFAPKAQTVLFSLENERPIFKGYNSMSDHDYVNMANMNQRNSTAKSNASNWLLEELKKGEISAQDIDSSGMAAGYSKSTLDRAKKELKQNGLIMSKKTGGNCAGVRATYSIIPIPESFDSADYM